MPTLAFSSLFYLVLWCSLLHTAGRGPAKLPWLSPWHSFAKRLWEFASEDDALWIVGMVYLEACHGVWCVNQLRRSSMWTMVLWDGLMICTGHPGIGRMTSGADEPCMTGPRRRRLHRHPELWKHQITAQSSKKLSEYLSTMRNVVKHRDRDDTQQNGIRW